MSSEPLRLAAAQATTLATLYGRARDAMTARPILADRLALAAWRKLEPRAPRTGMRPGDVIGVALRTKYFDDRARDFLTAHPDAVVLHLACGLDARAHRIDPPDTVAWYDLDLPEVLALREELYPPRPGCTSLAADLSGPGLDRLTGLPDDRPVLVIAEGLTMYLDRTAGEELLRTITGHFPQGTIIFDAMSHWAIARQRASGIVRHSRSRLHWGIDHPAEVISAVPALSCRGVVSPLGVPDVARLGLPLRALLTVLRHAPRVGTAAMLYRFVF